MKLTFRLREAIGDGPERRGVHADPNVARERNLDIFRSVGFIHQACSPVHDSVGPRIERRRRHRQIAGQRLNILDIGILDRLARDHLINTFGVGRRDIAGERAAQRHDIANHVGHAQSQIAGVDAAETPAHQADLAACRAVNADQQLAEFLAHAVNAADVPAETPWVSGESKQVEIAAKNKRRHIAR